MDVHEVQCYVVASANTPAFSGPRESSWVHVAVQSVVGEGGPFCSILRHHQNSCVPLPAPACNPAIVVVPAPGVLVLVPGENVEGVHVAVLFGVVVVDNGVLHREGTTNLKFSSSA